MLTCPTCPTCSTPLIVTPPRPGFGRATCPQCGGRYPVVIHRDIDGGLSAAFKAKRKPLTDVKKRRGLRMYDWQVARCRAAGKTPQQVLDEAVEQLPPLAAEQTRWPCKSIPGFMCVHNICRPDDGDTWRCPECDEINANDVPVCICGTTKPR